jgi:hypothetical protein
VQGSIGSESGFTVNVASGDVDFETRDGKVVTIKEGQTLSIPANNDICATPAASTATLMQDFDNTFEKTPSSALTPEQMLANAEVNNIPASTQKQANTFVHGVPVDPARLQGKEAKRLGGIAGDPQALINKYMQDLRVKNKSQVDIATRDIVAAAVARDASADDIAHIGTNAVQGAKGDYKVYVAATIINTLQDIKADLVNDVAPKVRNALPADQQPKLPTLIPNVVLPR